MASLLEKLRLTVEPLSLAVTLAAKVQLVGETEAGVVKFLRTCNIECVKLLIASSPENFVKADASLMARILVWGKCRKTQRCTSEENTN